MKITAFDIIRFGLWRELSMPKLSEGLNIFYGPNEAGKTTLLEFMRSQLYGFGGDRDRYVALPKAHERFAPEEGTAVPVNPLEDKTHIGRFEVLESPLGGGEMMLHCQNGIFHLRRTYDPDTLSGQARENLQLTGIDGQTYGEHFLNILTSGVDETTFNNVFAIGLDELQRLGTLGDTEAADLLFRLSIGLDRVSLVDVIKELVASRNRLLDPDGLYYRDPTAKPKASSRRRDVNEEDRLRMSAIPRMLRQREQLQEEIGQAAVALREYGRLLSERRHVDRTIESLAKEIEDFRHEERLYETAGRLVPIRDRREDVRLQIDAMGQVVPVPEEAIAKLAQLENDVTAGTVQIDAVKEQQDRFRTKIVALDINEPLCRLTPRIEVLLEEEKRILEIDAQITRFEQEISAIETELAEKESHLKHGRRRRSSTDRVANRHDRDFDRTFDRDGEPDAGPGRSATTSTTGESGNADAFRDDAISGKNAGSPSTSSQRTSRREDGVSLEDYRGPAKSLHQARQRYSTVKHEHDDVRERTRVLEEKVLGELQRHEVENLSEALEKTGDMVNRLRRRQVVGARLAEMLQYRRELDQVNAFLMQNQTLPPWMIGGIVALVALGAALVVLAAFKPAYAVLGVLGVMCAIGGIAAKVFVENNNKKKLQANQRQLAVLLGQLEQAKKEAEAIDARYPGDNRPIDERLLKAEQDLETIRKLLPVETQWHEASRDLKDLTQRLDQAKQSLAGATRRWKHWLRSAGLPEDWTILQIRDMLGRYDSAGALRRELDHRYESMNQRIRDMRIITDRIDRMVAETGLEFPDGLSYVDLLGQVREMLRVNEEALAERDRIRKEIKALRITRKKHEAARDRTQRRLELLLNRYGVETVPDLKKLHQRYKNYLAAVARHEAIVRECVAAVGGFCEESQIAALIEPLIEPETREELPVKMSQLLRRIEIAQAKLHAELEHRGRLDEQLVRLVEDKTPLEKQRELAVLEEKIQDALRQWRTLAAASYLLDDIRRSYERDRQPQTLFEASEILHELTGGRYHRVWTPIGEETLYVDDSDGNTLDVSWLSRGTREQLFIAIRLALTSAFLKHGTVLPLILDDVLVNFDTARAVAAARMLKRVAATGRQVFLFTCHEHICRIFQKLDTPVRILPKIHAGDRKIRVLLPVSLLKKRRAARLRDREERRRRESERHAETLARRRLELNEAILRVQRQATARKVDEVPFVEGLAETDTAPEAALPSSENVPTETMDTASDAPPPGTATEPAVDTAPPTDSSHS